MHGRMARYAIQGDAHELARTAEEGMLPIFQSQPGFKAYSLLESGDEIISFSAWESADDAEAANRASNRRRMGFIGVKKIYQKLRKSESSY